MIKEASHYESLDDNKVECHLCPINCHLNDGSRGVCHSRKNIEGKLFTLNYGEAVSIAIDPIEKKPLYHYFPGTVILSTGANFCNLACMHCQNWTISQEEVSTRYISPEALVTLAEQNNSIGVAFTYTEPVIWFEYIRDTAPLLKEAGLKVVLVTNGFINSKPLEELIPFIDAVNVDLKSMEDSFYKKVCKGKLQPVLDTISKLSKSNVHLEITNLLIPGLNDTDSELVKLADFIASCSDSIPLHLSAYHPDYKMHNPPTDRKTIRRAYDIVTKKLKYVYVGNITLEGKSDTVCPQCGNLLIERNYYEMKIVDLDGIKCGNCQYQINLIR